MQLVEYAVVTLVQLCRPDMISSRLVLEIAVPAGAIGLLQVLGLDLGDHPPMTEYGVGGGGRRRRMRGVRLADVVDDHLGLIVDRAAS